MLVTGRDLQYHRHDLTSLSWHIAASEGCNNRPCNLHVTLHCVTSGRLRNKAIKLISLHEVSESQNYPDSLIWPSPCFKIHSFLPYSCILNFPSQMFKGVYCKYLMAYVPLHFFFLYFEQIYVVYFVCLSIRQNNDVLLSIFVAYTCTSFR